MDLSAPYSALLTDSVGSLLTTLAGTTRPLSGRELARLSTCPHSTTRAALARFAEHGLVDVQVAGAGAALLYTLNRKHVAADAILVLATLRQRLVDRLRAEIDAWQMPPLHASVYGSAARGDGDTGSDIDVFLVRPVDAMDENLPWRRQVDRLPELILGWTGNHAGITEVGIGDVARLVREEAPILGGITRDAVVLCGASVNELLEDAAR
jgi:hypothetical protein